MTGLDELMVWGIALCSALVFATVGGIAARRKGRSVWGWFIACWILSIVGVVIILALPTLRAACPRCGAMYRLRVGEQTCASCEAQLPDRFAAERLAATGHRYALECPGCGMPYRLEDYRPDVTEIFCRQLPGPLDYTGVSTAPMEDRMSTSRVLVAVVSVVLCFSFGACKKKDGGDAKSKEGDKMAAASAKGEGSNTKPSAKDTPKLSAKDNPKVGDSCKGLSATDGKLACDGNSKIFCSSYSKYKWKKLGECKGGTKCVVSANGKSASCK